MRDKPDRRATDGSGEDHHEDRETDWRKAPRPVLIVAIYALMGALSFAGSFAYWLVSDRIQKIEASQRDARWDMLAKAVDDAGYARKRADQIDEAVNGDDGVQEQLRKLRAEVAEVKRLVSRKER
jgi:hypothetical protein